MQKWVGSQAKLSSTPCGVRAVLPASYFHKVMFAGRLHMVISSVVGGRGWPSSRYGWRRLTRPGSLALSCLACLCVFPSISKSRNPPAAGQACDQKKGRSSVSDSRRRRSLALARLGGMRLSSSTEMTEAEAWESQVTGEWELMSEWDSWGVQGWIGQDGSNSWPQTLAVCPVGKVVQQVEDAAGQGT